MRMPFHIKSLWKQSQATRIIYKSPYLFDYPIGGWTGSSLSFARIRVFILSHWSRTIEPSVRISKRKDPSFAPIGKQRIHLIYRDKFNTACNFFDKDYNKERVLTIFFRFHFEDENMQNLQDVHNMQNMQDVQDKQNLQNMQNGENMQNMQITVPSCRSRCSILRGGRHKRRQ